jgi:hypothetical protein
LLLLTVKCVHRRRKVRRREAGGRTEEKVTHPLSLRMVLMLDWRMRRG